jgi:hypothetical protein
MTKLQTHREPVDLIDRDDRVIGQATRGATRIHDRRQRRMPRRSNRL